MGFKPYHFCHCLKIFGKRFAPITYPTLGKRKIILESVLKWDISVRKRVASPFEIFFFHHFFTWETHDLFYFFDFNLSTKILTQKQTSTQKFHRIKGPILDATHPPTAAPSSWIPSHPIPSIQQPQGDQHVCCWAQLLPHTFRGMAGFHERAAEEPSPRTQWRGAFLPQLPQTGKKKGLRGKSKMGTYHL